MSERVYNNQRSFEHRNNNSNNNSQHNSNRHNSNKYHSNRFNSNYNNQSYNNSNSNDTYNDKFNRPNNRRNYNQSHNQSYNQTNSNDSVYNVESDRVKRDVFIGNEIESDTKTQILDYLYLNVDLYQLRYTILKTQDNAQLLKQQTYHVTPHFHGYNYFLIIKKIDNQIGAYIIYKMDLKFNRQEINDSKIKIYALDYTDENLLESYDETIIDGKLVFKKEEKIFLINDVLYYRSQKYLTFKLEDKFKNIDNDINKLNTLLDNNFMIKFIRLYKYSEMNDLVFNKIRNSDFKINGLIFIPIRSSRIYIYINDSEFDAIKNSPNLEVNSEITNIKLPTNIDIKPKKMLLQKTQIVDVYEVFELNKEYRFGIACVPTIDLSHKLRRHFTLNDQMIIDCEYDNNFSKWKPIM